MGLAFAEKFQAYCNSLQDVSIEKIAKVEKNPDRSKHLETAKAKVLDIELDFVNLRSEEYAEESRIPTQVVRIHRVVCESLTLKSNRRLELHCRTR